MILENARYPIIALANNALYVYLRVGAIIKCYRGLISETFQETIFIDSDSSLWRCESVKVARSIIPLWKRLFVADLVEVDLHLSEPKKIASVDIVKQMISKCAQRAQSFVLDTGDHTFESERNIVILNKVKQCINSAETVRDVIDGIQEIIKKNG